jgi:anti-sigma factor RsiW
MNCEHYQSLFFDYERKTLAAQAERELSAHLQDCEQCAAMLANLQQVSALLDIQHAPSPQAEARFRERLQREAQVAARNSRSTRNASASLAGMLQQFWRRYWPLQPIGGFCYSVALLLLGLAGGQYLPPRSFGFGADPGQFAEQNVTRERLIQLCAVQPQPTPNLF